MNDNSAEGSAASSDVRIPIGSSGITMPFLNLKVHAEIDHQIRLGLEGIESSAVIGAKGTGKTISVNLLADRLEREELINPKGAQGARRNIFRMVASNSTGAKTLLLDLYGLITQTKMTAAGSRATSPRELAELLARACKGQHIHLIIEDEAQKVNAHNLDQLREIPDRARAVGHEMGVLLVGNAGLRGERAECGELGHRIATVIEMPEIDRAFIGESLTDLNKDFEALRKQLGKSGWSQLEEQLVGKVAGKLRRLTTIVANAVVLSRRLNRPIDAVIMASAIQKLSEEV
jgi:DNA transposition AAA+ family ATPase